MALSTLALDLTAKLSANGRILTDPQDAIFKESLYHWSELNAQIPGAVIKPATEPDVQISVSIPSQINPDDVSTIHKRWTLNIMTGSICHG